MQDGLQIADKSADLAFFDEAHRVAGPLAKRVAVLINTPHIEKRVSLTATPRVLVDLDQANMLAGMNIDEQFGRRVYSLSFRDAIGLGALVDYEVHAIAVNAGDIDKLNVDNLREAVSTVAVAKAIKSLNLKCGITFHTRVSTAAQFAETLKMYLPELGVRNSFVATLNRTHNAAQRAEVMRAIDKSSHPSVLTNVRILGEGFDYSALDFVVFSDPKTSAIDIIQNIGRVMRVCDGKDKGHVILPVFVRSDDPIEFEDGAFATIIRVARALSEVDESIASPVEATRTTRERSSNYDIITRFITERVMFHHVNGDVIELDKNTVLRTLEIRPSTHDKWWDSFEAWKADKTTPEALCWASAQRTCIRKNLISEEKRQLLIDAGLSMTPRFDSWLAAVDVFRRGEASEEWFTQQRYRFKKGELSDEQVAILEKAGFEFDGNFVAWKESLERAVKTQSNAKIGKWLSTQRSLTKRKAYKQKHLDELAKHGLLERYQQSRG